MQSLQISPFLKPPFEQTLFGGDSNRVVRTSYLADCTRLDKDLDYSLVLQGLQYWNMAVSRPASHSDDAYSNLVVAHDVLPPTS